MELCWRELGHRVSDAGLRAWEQGRPGATRVAWRGLTRRLEGGSELGLEQGAGHRTDSGSSKDRLGTDGFGGRARAASRGPASEWGTRDGEPGGGQRGGGTVLRLARSAAPG